MEFQVEVKRSDRYCIFQISTWIEIRNGLKKICIDIYFRVGIRFQLQVEKIYEKKETNPHDI
jgi:hypothetical protein